MNNVSCQLVVQINHVLSKGQIDWSDSKPQKSKSSLTIKDLIPSEEDGGDVHDRAVTYIMRFLFTIFKSYLLFKVCPQVRFSSHSFIVRSSAHVGLGKR